MLVYDLQLIQALKYMSVLMYGLCWLKKVEHLGWFEE